MNKGRWVVWCMCACGALAGAGVERASAQPRAVEARRGAPQARDAMVVQIDGEDVYLDVGRGAVVAGATFEVLRPIETRHPVTHAVLRDRFPIAQLVIVEVGESLSIARVTGTPHRPVELADLAHAPTPDAEEVVAASVGGGGGTARPSDAPARVCPPAPAQVACPQTGTDIRTAEILRVWAVTFGLLPEARITVWERFLATSAASPYANYARQELADAQRELARARADTPAGGSLAQLAPLGRAYVGEPLEFAGIVTRGVPVRDLSVFVRPRGEPVPFTRVALTLDAAGHARGAVPPALLALVGFEWFAEITLADGRTANVAASPESPFRVEVWASPSAPLPTESDRSRVRFSTDYVDFNRSRLNDYYVAFEGDFTYRLGLTYLPSVRVGYGHLQGESGSVRSLDVLGAASREVGFTYGFIEPELALHELFSVALRITAGLGLPEGHVDGLRGGVQLRFRIGSATGTNLVLAGETIPELGLRGYIGLAWLPVPNWPMAAEVHVTDQPGNGEIAVRGVFELGHRFTHAFALSTRLSYQGRNIDHSGFGVGLAATFDW